MPYLERDGDVFVLYLGNEGQTDSENRFHPDWIAEIHAHLDTVEASEGPAALVSTASGKFYSNGLDTDWLFGNLDQMHGYLDKVHSIYTRLLTFPMPTVAAVNGHAFGAGAMLATSHDFRLMRADRGFYSLPEVHLGMPFTIGMNALLTERLTNQVAVKAMTTGHRFPADEAIAAGIVDGKAEADALVAAAVAQAAALAGNRKPNLPVIKRALHANALAGLAVPTTPENLAFAAG
ncbi:enoyl-CoA hydratase/isomerase family protein [Nocardia cyriacigeorgica]|uniref:Enoyl-CoA hydratase/isomerase family protein n=1 Tax=Nocardia cyriacigeorgica TaxID=135487 RepID=A0A6P1D8Z1_9NOCA|nr:enoyl-CoA hydratase-related protein [Nocardia cyriacigeorgica]NEW41124.1 enoyl-CoA hydratase/isomerase family protein [Nocardia cyriacigeorgica]NEW46011.1 enoyl-CoA hydratase/isomerase family protein [Nocardia cyriacigeorgica]NEW53388.1 enoyl-CoA hydratase/isomerase family protein [Nocardia cyriacigeorgica]NEW58019.1 enoyl-CoA hydratase/isomerase family protein [Nocardia cyriacigeorgica]